MLAKHVAACRSPLGIASVVTKKRAFTEAA